MRSPLTRIRPAGAAVAAAVLLTACGGSGDGEPAAASGASASSTTPSSSAAPGPATGSPDPTAAPFCAEVSSVFGQVSTAFQSAAPEQLPTLLGDVAGAFGSVTPPEEIAADWHAIHAVLGELQATASSLDLRTSEGRAQYSAAEAELTADIAAAQTAVTDYVVAHCRTEAGPTG